jgi:hypothetical protein
MFLFVLQTTIISIIFIYVTHSLFLYFRDTMTVPKIKDLVNAPSKQYQAMYDLISSRDDSTAVFSEEITPQSVDMKNELTNFFKKKVRDNRDTTYISDL